MDSGFNSGGVPFECVVAQKNGKKVKAKKAGLIIAYVLYAVLCFTVGGFSRLFVPLLALVPISLWVIIFFTWRYTNVQYEYSFFAGDITVSRILNERFRKVITVVHISKIDAILRCDEAHKAEIERFAAENTIFAASDEESPNLYVALWHDEEKDQKIKLYFEPDEKAIKILRYYNAAAMAK